MGTTPEDRGAPEAPPEDLTATISGVRTEHQLRMQLRDAMKRNTTFERALRESAAFAYGRRDLADLRPARSHARRPGEDARPGGSGRQRAVTAGRPRDLLTEPPPTKARSAEWSSPSNCGTRADR